MGMWPVKDTETGDDLFTVETLPGGQLRITMARNPLDVVPDAADTFRFFLGAAIGLARQEKPAARPLTPQGVRP